MQLCNLDRTDKQMDKKIKELKEKLAETAMQLQQEAPEKCQLASDKDAMLWTSGSELQKHHPQCPARSLTRGMVHVLACMRKFRRCAFRQLCNVHH
jgi:hypothetical protein